MATTLQNSYLENIQEQRSLVGYSPSGLKELDMAEQLNTAEHFHREYHNLIVYQGSTFDNSVFSKNFKHNNIF